MIMETYGTSENLSGRIELFYCDRYSNVREKSQESLRNT